MSSTLNGSVYRRNVSRSVYSDSVSLYPDRENGYSTPRPTMAHLDVPRAPSRARSTNSTTNHLEVPRAPSRARSPRMAAATPEVAAVDPTLEDAQKAGNNYHITMSLNAALADAGLPASVAMTTGRASQMDHVTSSSRNQDYAASSRSQTLDYGTGSRNQAIDYGTGSRSVSRIDVYANGTTPVPAPRLHLDQGSRNGAVSRIQIDGIEVVGRSSSPFVVASSQQRELIALNGGYTIKSVQPSAARKEVHTTVERAPGNNTVGFDLELIGGQTTTIKETVDTESASGVARLPKSTGGRHESSWETTYTTSRHHGSDDRQHPSKAGKNRKPKPADRGSDSPDLGTMIDDEDFNSVEFTRTSTNQRPNARMIGMGTKRGYETSGRPNAGTIGRGTTRDNYEPRDIETEFRSHRETVSTEDRRNPWLLQDDDDDDEADQSLAIYRQLVKGAPPGTVQQRVTVEKDEDDIVEDGPQIKDMLNVDTVSEKVLVFVGNDIAEMTIKVRTERIVPIKGSNNMFRKSAVTVNRIIEVDMMATYERQRIYENVIDKQRTTGRDLNQKETFDLYKAFLRLAEEDEGDAARDQVRIDKTTDEAQLEDLKRSSNFYEKRNSFDIESSNNSRGFSGTTGRTSSRYRESRFQEYGNDDSELSSAIY